MNSNSVRADESASLDIDMLLHSVRRMMENDRSWSGLVDMGLVQLCGEAGGGLTDALLVLRELGRSASDLPLAEAIVLNLFAPGLINAEARVAFAVGDDEAFCEGDALSGRFRLVEGAAAADYLLVTTKAGALRIVARDGPGVSILPTSALVDGLCDVVISQAPVFMRHDLGRPAEDMLAVMRLCLCARALGAASRGFEAVTQYAMVRRQFGQAIGTYQAIQHKLADSHIALSTSALLIHAAAQSFEADAEHWRSNADAAIAFASPALRDVALQTQHAFGAIGFAEEHEAPALFRRVHADTVRFGGARQAQARLGRQIVEGHAALAALLTDEQDPTAAFRQRLREWLGENWTPAHRQAQASRPFEDRDWDMAFLERLGRDGWTTLNWPKSAGGMDATPFEQLAFTEELQKAGAPEHAMICPCRLLAPEIIAQGTQTLRDTLLPALRAGTVTGCLGYSEPEAGSDLASLRTTAVRDSDDYIINGQKIWTTDGHRASHMILAARTDPDLKRRHAGISLFILPMDTPGITVRPMKGLHGHVFCSIFFDDVRLPAHHRLGEEGQGWAILSNALANERITMGGFVSQLAVLLQQVIVSVRDDPDLAASSATHERIGTLVSRLLAGQVLARDSITKMAGGGVPLVEAAMSKVYASELAQEICEASLDLLGGQALLSGDADGAPANGLIEEILRLSIMYVVGGGSNEIQRSVIAGRGLGLGR